MALKAIASCPDRFHDEETGQEFYLCPKRKDDGTCRADQKPCDGRLDTGSQSHDKITTSFWLLKHEQHGCACSWSGKDRAWGPCTCKRINEDCNAGQDY